MFEINEFDAVRISLASPEQIRSWSYGEVTKPEIVVSIRRYATRVLFAISVESR